MRLTIELEHEPETDRWIAEVREVRGALVYGATREDAIARVKALALTIIADEVAHRERDLPLGQPLVFEAAA